MVVDRIHFEAIMILCFLPSDPSALEDAGAQKQPKEQVFHHIIVALLGYFLVLPIKYLTISIGSPPSIVSMQ
jgi:hypothetical protein